MAVFSTAAAVGGALLAGAAGTAGAVIGAGSAVAGAVGGAVGTGLGMAGSAIGAGAGAIGSGIGAVGGAIGSGAGMAGSAIGNAGGAGGLLESVNNFLSSPAGKAMSEMVGAEKAAQYAQQQWQLKATESEKDRQLSRDLQSGRITAEEALAEKERQYKSGESEKTRQFDLANINRQYQEAEAQRQRASGILGGSESQLMQETSQASPELLALQNRLKQKTAEDVQNLAGEQRAELTRSGVRGAERATLLGRSIGDYRNQQQTNIDKLALEDAQARRQARTNYLANKSLTATGKAI